VRRYLVNDPSELPEQWDQPRQKPRGRPSADKGMLCGDRDALVGWLSAEWAECGWELLHVKSTADIRRALAPIANDSRHSQIEHFLQDSSSEATAAEVRKSAAATSLKHAQRINAQERRDLLRKDFDEVQHAQSQATAEQLAAIEPILRQRRADYETAERNLKSAENEEKDADAKLADQEAGFAQRELLKFIRSGKYAHNPLNLANAMAGIRCHTSDAKRVYAGCWQSFARCSKLECAIWPTYQFQRFEIIQSIWNRRDKYPQLSPVELFRLEIPKLPKIKESEAKRFSSRITIAEKKRIVNGFVRDNFMDEFRNLRLAIEESLRKCNRPDQMPFLILARFTKSLSQSTNAVERVLVGSERLRRNNG